MKHFTNLEQDIIKQIAKPTENISLFFIFEEYLKAYKSVRLDLQLGLLSYPKTTKYDINRIVKELTIIAMLLKYLDYHKYIYPIDELKCTVQSIEPTIKTERECKSIELRDDVINLIYYSQHKFYISDDLHFIIKHNFMTYEDLELENAIKQTGKASWTLLFAIITLLATCILPFIPYTHSHQDGLHNETIFAIRTIDTTLQKSSENLINEYKAYQDSCRVIQTKKVNNKK